jgi:hypothetical protein
MEYYQKISEHPVIVELRKRLDKCRGELLKLLSDWHYLQNVLQPQLIFTYENIFGDLEEEFQNKSRVASELDRRLELLSIKLRKGETLNRRTVEFVNRVVKNEFKRMDSPKITERTNPNEIQSKNYINSENQINNEIPVLYRKIVKKLHPDIAGESDLFKKYWDNVQDAYRNRNYHRLRLFHQILYSSVNEKYNDPRSEEMTLRSEIREFEVNISAEKRRIDSLMKQEPFIYVDKLDDKIWIARRKRKIMEKLFQIERQIRHHERVLSSLINNDDNQHELFEFNNDNSILQNNWNTTLSLI